MWLKLLALVVLGITMGIAQDTNCTNTCDCCNGNPNNGSRDLGDICKNHTSRWSCTYGCKDGYYGGKCWNKCPEYCTRCAREFGSNNFESDYEICYICADGYYNGTEITDCSTPCPANCAQNKCNKTTGNCLQGCLSKNWSGDKCNTCADTWYGNNCEEPCPDNCKDRICNNNGECTTGCKDGYWGYSCWNYCPESCVSCHRQYGVDNKNYICYSCVDGYYGTKCGTNCPTNCAENKCDKTTGNCLQGCLNNWSGDKCNVCDDTWYGNNCDIRCPDICKDRMCNSNGDCTTGCKDENLDGPKCDQCIGGKYGENCNIDCPVNCNSDTCERNDGICSNGCKGNFGGVKCDKCKPGYYGENCSNQCSNCLNGVCDRSTGRCIDCDSGTFGELCDKSCSSGCKNSVCDRSTAVCPQQCRTGYSGDKCCVHNNGCKICDTTTSCSKCKSGFYGNSCGKSCPSNCAGACDKETGNCEACKEIKYYGAKCDTPCSVNCLDGQCVKTDGRCISCKARYYGQTCNETCPTNCEDNMCGQNDGVCNNCIAGFHGDVCDIKCKRQDCINNTCSQTTGVCALGCINGCEEEPPPSSPVGPAVGGAIGGLVIIALIVVVIWFVLRRRRSQQETNTKYNTDELMSDINPAVVNNGVYENCDSVTTRENKPTAPKVVSKPKQKFDNIALEESHELDTDENEVDNDYYTFRNVIKVADLQAYVTQNAGKYLSNEFKRLAKGLKLPCTVATRSENIALNRYNGLYPYDHSRVKLAHDKMFFINACYIKGNQQQNAYIASLGPTKVTTDNFATFWKMVWYEKSDIIVMLTNLQEPSGMKCQQYWPELGESLTFHDLEIKCDSMEDFSEYTLRSFTVFKGKVRRTVSQLHFTAWPDKSVPNNVTSLIEFRQIVKSTYTLSQGPVIVHCSAGVGRTGTYIAIDLLTEEGMNEGNIDVFGCIRKMREQRVNMVQTPDQYEYVHRAVVYTLTFDVDYTPTETFNEYVMSLTDSQYAALFKKLSTSIEAVNEEREQAVSENKKYRDKNRSISDVPDNSSRPMLYLNRAFNDSNYINAVYVNGFKRKNRFILAQTPLSATLDDFVCLIYQEKCSCIVSVEITDSQKQDVGCYIPAENESLTFGSFVITCMKYQNKYNHQYRQLNISNNGKQSTGERIVHHYQYTNWKNNEKVPSSDADFVQFVKDTQSSVHGDGKSPMLLHCLTGGKKCGLFCTVSLLLERADIIRQISVANTVRLLRLRRPNVIPNKEQLKFAHQCVASQMEMLSTYTNFSM